MSSSNLEELKQLAQTMNGDVLTARKACAIMILPATYPPSVPLSL